MKHVFTDERQAMMDETIHDCADKMRAISLEPAAFGEHVLPISNGRFLGLCRCADSDAGIFAIECAPSLDARGATEILFHELAHTLPGCQNHAKGFLAACKVIDEEYGTNCEMDRVHYYCSAYFKETFRLVMRFTGAVGDRYGMASDEGTLELPLYEIEEIVPDGRRRVREISTGRTFCADLVEIRALKYHEPWQFAQYPDMAETLRMATANSNRTYFSSVVQHVTPADTSPGRETVVVGGQRPGLRFETVGLEGEAVSLVRNPISGRRFPASIFVLTECSYRRRYLAYEAVMRSGIGRLPRPWMRCERRECGNAVSSLAALIESVWNISDRIREGVWPSRLKAQLNTLDNRLLDAAIACERDLEETLQYACGAFVGYSAHRGIGHSADAMRLLADYLRA